MKVGDYVRTKNGNIFKIKKIDDELFLETFYYVSNDTFVTKDLILKSSPNIIDLIEVGDYVNGKLVIKVATDYIFDYSEEIKIIYFSENDYIYRNQDIKSIVTREQFSSIEYKVGENE